LGAEEIEQPEFRCHGRGLHHRRRCGGPPEAKAMIPDGAADECDSVLDWTVVILADKLPTLSPQGTRMLIDLRTPTANAAWCFQQAFAEGQADGRARRRTEGCRAVAVDLAQRVAMESLDFAKFDERKAWLHYQHP
jgi:hypothetical protein